VTEGYLFRLERTSYKSRDLVYESDGHKLVVYLEMSGVSDVDWVGGYSEFSEWETPRGEQITSEQRAEILKRLVDWSRSQNLCVALEKKSASDKWINDQKALGFATRAHKNGTVVISTPPRIQFIARMLKKLFPEK
jgi:hypothetical protein